VKRLVTYANYQFWVFAVGGAIFALLYGTLWERRPATTAPYDVAIAVDPDYALGHYNLGVAAQQAGMLEVARAHYAAASEVDPHDHTPCFNHAQVALELGVLDEALIAARCAVDHAPDAESWDVLGQVLVARKEHAPAIDALQTAVGLRPGHAAARIELGLAYASTSRFDDARTTLREAIALRPELAEAWFNLAQVTWKLGDAAEAYRLFVTSVAMDPKQTKAMSNLAYLDLQANRTGWAKWWLDRLLAIEPDNQPARQLRDQVP
jgi:tetratricopeptide (TPR) repeat protein